MTRRTRRYQAGRLVVAFGAVSTGSLSAALTAPAFTTQGRVTGCGPFRGTATESFQLIAICACVMGGGVLCGPPRSNARASGPRGYATTSSVLAIVLVAGSFDRFVN